MDRKVRLGGGANSLRIDPPPFFLEREILFDRSRAWISTLGVGLLFLAPFLLLFDRPGGAFPSLGRLVVASFAAGTFYLGVRFLSYKGLWWAVGRAHEPVRGIHPAARGELPRNAYLIVLLAPLMAFVPGCWLIFRSNRGLGPELWLAIAVIAGSALTDLRAARHVLSMESSCWIKETPRGLDVLRPVDTE